MRTGSGWEASSSIASVAIPLCSAGAVGVVRFLQIATFDDVLPLDKAPGSDGGVAWDQIASELT